MTQLRSTTIVFRYRGSRNYVHITDLFDAVLPTDGREDVTDLRMTVHGEIQNCACSINYYDEDPKSTEGKLRGRFDHQGRRLWFDLKESSATQVDCERRSYDEKLIFDGCNIVGDQIMYRGSAPFEFIELIVAMNKHLLSHLNADKPGRWVFTGIELESTFGEDATLRVRFIHNFRDKLFKSEIYGGDRMLGYIYFSLQ